MPFFAQPNTVPMKMVMYLEKDLVDTVKIEKDKISQPGYLSARIRNLREKHASLLQGCCAEPEFLLYPLVNGASPQQLPGY